MHRIIGFVLILVGCSGLGMWYCLQFRKQQSNLQAMCRILELLMGQIRYGRCTLGECCLQLSERVEEPYKSCFLAIYQRTCEGSGESFGQICKEQLQQDMLGVVADKEDKALFISCFTESGFEEGRMQLRSIEQIKEELEKHAYRISKENASRCRLALSLGMMSGLLLVILLV